MMVAFFSHDAKQIIWRAFYPETDKEIRDYKNLIDESLIRPMNLQLRIMNVMEQTKDKLPLMKVQILLLFFLMTSGLFFALIWQTQRVGTLICGQ